MTKFFVDSKADGAAREALLSRFGSIRHATERLAEPLTTVDQVVQSMVDVSPTKWHLAHTSWFFEIFLLKTFDAGYRVSQNPTTFSSIPTIRRSGRSTTGRGAVSCRGRLWQRLSTTGPIPTTTCTA